MNYIRQRSVGLCIVLTLVTCGVYGLYWMYCLNEEINMVTGRPGTTGGMVIVFSFVTCGIYTLYWYYKMGEKQDGQRMENGWQNGYLAIVYLVLAIFGLGIVSQALMQSELNKSLPGGEF